MTHLKSNLICSIIMGLFIMHSAANLFGQTGIWAGTWSCAPYAAGSGNTPPSPYLANNSLRQVIRVSIGGDTLRMKFSNKTCSTPVAMNSVNIAVSTGGSSIDSSTITQLKFDGESEVTMNEFSSVTSDPFAFPLTPGMRLAITIYYGQAASAVDMTSHVASRTDSYILVGNQSSSVDFSGAVVTAHWFHINTIEVQAPDTAGCVGILGNSITDGYGLTGGLQNRWTDFFSQELLDNESTRQVGVLNLGIGATSVTGPGPTTGISRFKDDILGQLGLRWVIIFNGTNDIGANVPATTITDAYQEMIDDAHERNIKVYGATITPFKGHSYYTEEHEEVRNTVNEWIRSPGNFDACIDFDKAIRDPDDTTRLLAVYSNDWLHPNADGYEFLGRSVNLDLFIEIEDNPLLLADAGSDQTLLESENSGIQSVKLDGSASFDFGHDIASFIWREEDDTIATGKTPVVVLPTGTHTIELIVSDEEGSTAKDSVKISIVTDSGVWIEAECGTVGSLWNIAADENASNDAYVTIKPGNNSTDEAPADNNGLITYTFDAEETGTYYIYSRLICPSANDDSFWLKMDNGSFASWNNINAPSWQWVKNNNGYSLSEGSHTLTIGYREDGAKMDKLWISRFDADLSDEGSEAVKCNVLYANNLIRHDIHIYPNPVSEELTVLFPDLPADISIYNIDCKKVFMKNSNSSAITINMDNYNPGIYFMKITSQGQTNVKKFIKY